MYIFKQPQKMYYVSRKWSTSSPQNKQEQSINTEPNAEFNLSYETIVEKIVRSKTAEGEWTEGRGTR